MKPFDCCRFFPKQFDLKNLHKFYDTTGDGAVSYNEFVNALSTNKLSTRCFNMVENAWSKVDKNKSNECSG